MWVQILSPLATAIEKQTVKWLAEFIGVSPTCGGILVSGGNMANFTGFLAARTAKAPKSLKEDGLTDFIAAIHLSNAQFNINRYLIGGNINYYNTSNPTSVGFYSNLQVSKVIKDNSVVGLMFSYSSNNDNYTAVSPNKTRSYTTGVFYRKYTSLAKRFYFFNEVDASYSYTKNVQQNFSNGQYYNAKSNGIAVSYIPGISYNVWKRLQMELSIPSLAFLSYSHVSTINNLLPQSVSPQKKDSYGAGINFNSNVISNFAIGFKVILGKMSYVNR